MRFRVPFNSHLDFFTLQAPTVAPGATKEVEPALLILAGSVLFVVGMGEDRGQSEGIACASSTFKLPFGLFYTFLHFFTLQAPTAAPGATKEVEPTLLILAGSVLFALVMGGDLGHKEVVACASECI